MHIEQHVALLVFPANIVVDDSQWKALMFESNHPRLGKLAGYKYVELTGEHITFVVDAPNDRLSEIPANMPRLPECGMTGKLTSGYQFPYTRAAAAVDLSEGTLSVCGKGGRIDTRLMLNTTGTLTIVAFKSGQAKTLLLNTAGNPTIYLANVPSPQNAGVADAHNGSPHYLAYYRMIGREESRPCAGAPASSARTSVPDCNFPTTEPATEVAHGVFAQLHRRLRALFHSDDTTGPPFPGYIFAVNAECSNSQWP